MSREHQQQRKEDDGSLKKYIVYAIVAVVGVVGISYLSSNNDVRKRKYPAALTEQVRKLVNDSAQNAIISSKIGNPMLALTYVFKSAETVNTLRALIGDDDLFEITEMNMSQVADMIRQHQKIIFDRVLAYLPPYIAHDVWNSGLLEQLQNLENAAVENNAQPAAEEPQEEPEEPNEPNEDPDEQAEREEREERSRRLSIDVNA